MYFKGKPYAKEIWKALNLIFVTKGVTPQWLVHKGNNVK